MWWVRVLFAKLEAFFRPRRADEEMSREMAAHLAMLEDEFRRRGLGAEEAGRAARRRFGKLDRARERHRETRSVLWLEQFRQDLLYAARYLGANKSYTAVVVLTLALGIGANSAVFSVIHPLMLEPLPFDRPGQLVQLVESASPTGWTRADRRAYPLPPDRAAELREHVDGLAGLFQAFGYRTTLFESGEPESVNVAGASKDTFSTLRARPLLGRLLEPRDHVTGAEPVAVLSYAAWRRYWGGGRDIAGRHAELDTRTGRRSHRIVGVLPEDFAFPLGNGSAREFDVWTPGDFSGHGSGSGLTTVLRVHDGTSIEAAADEVNAVLDGMDLRTASFDPGTGELSFAPAGRADLVSVKARQVESIRSALVVLTATVALVLLMACTNVANLMLGRAAARAREMSIRGALGATYWRLSRQLLTEGLVLCLAGGAVGLVVALGGVRLMSLWPGNARPGAAGPFLELPPVTNIELDGAVLAFTVAITLLTGLLFGLAPAAALARESRLAGAGNGASAAAPQSRGMRSRDALIVAEVALAMTLLVGAGLLTQSFWRLTRVDPGFSAENVVTFEVTASRSRFEQTPPFGGGVAYFEDVAARLDALPGVGAVGYGPRPFLFGAGNGIEVEIPGGPPGGRVANVLDVGGDYLEALGVPLHRGRGLSSRYDAAGPVEVLVNETFAREHLGGRDPVGMLVDTSLGRSLETPFAGRARIVGVVGDIRRAGLDSDPYPQVFVDYRQAAARGNVDYWWAFFAVRTSQPDAVTENALAIVRRYDSEARVDNIAPLGDVVADSVTAPRFFSTLFGVFAMIGVTLALVGIFGVVSYAVTQRTKEIGIRMALGAGRGPVLAMALRHGAVLAGVGITLGLAAAFAASRYLASLLFGVEALDAPTFAAVALGFFAISMLATWLPARRATRVDPLVALRHE